MAGFKESDLASRVAVVRDIPLQVDSANLATLGQLKCNIPNIGDYIQDDAILSEQKY